MTKQTQTAPKKNTLKSRAKEAVREYARNSKGQFTSPNTTPVTPQAVEVNVYYPSSSKQNTASRVLEEALKSPTTNKVVAHSPYYYGMSYKNKTILLGVQKGAIIEHPLFKSICVPYEKRNMRMYALPSEKRGIVISVYDARTGLLGATLEVLNWQAYDNLGRINNGIFAQLQESIRSKKADKAEKINQKIYARQGL